MYNRNIKYEKKRNYIHIGRNFKYNTIFTFTLTHKLTYACRQTEGRIYSHAYKKKLSNGVSTYATFGGVIFC